MSRGERSNRRLRRHIRVPTDVRLTWESRDSEVLYLIRMRTMAGLEAARARGRKGERKALMDEKKLSLASTRLKYLEIPVKEVIEAAGGRALRSIVTSSPTVGAVASKRTPLGSSIAYVASLAARIDRSGTRTLRDAGLWMAPSCWQAAAGEGTARFVKWGEWEAWALQNSGLPYAGA